MSCGSTVRLQEVDADAVVGRQPLERPLILREDAHVVVHGLVELDRRRVLGERERRAVLGSVSVTELFGSCVV